MASQTGGDAVLDHLVEHGQDWVFGVIGSNSTALFSAIPSRPVRYMQGVHEASAIAMADGYARVRGEATCLVYMVPGAANGLQSTYVAWTDETPLLIVISDQDSRVKNGTTGLLEADLAAVTAPFTRQSRTLPAGAPIREWLERSRHVALDRRGPVVLAIPQDILLAPATPTPAWATPASHHHEPSTPDDIGPVVAALRTAEHPLLVAGGQVRRMGASPALQRVAERFGIVVAHDNGMQDRLAMAPWHPNFAGSLLPPTAPDPKADDADVVVIVGAHYFSYVHGAPGDRFFDRATFVAHVNADPAQIDAAFLADWSSAAGPKGFLERLEEELAATPPDDALLARRREWVAARNAAVQPDLTNPVGRAAAALSDALAHGWVVDESTASWPHVLAGLRSGDAGRLMAASSGALGWGTSAACGVAAATGGPVTCTIGDGALRFGLHGLWTAQAHHLPITYFVFDNRSFGSTESFARITAQELGRQPVFVGSDFTHLDRGIADTLEGFGIPTRSVGADGDVRAALVEAWGAAAEGPSAVVVDVGDGPRA